MSTDRAAQRVVQALAAEGLLAPGSEQRSRAVVAGALAGGEAGAAAAGARAPGVPKLVEVVAYLGAALVLAAGFLFVSRSWEDLGDVGQVSFLGAVAVVLGVAGGVTIAGPVGDRAHEVRRRLSGTLLTGSALAAGLTVGVAIEVFTDTPFRGIPWPQVAAGAVVAVVSAVGYRFSSTAVGLLGILAGAVTADTNLASELAGDEALGVGVSLFALGVVWLALTELGVFAQLTTARSLGVAVALLGAQVASFTGAQSWIGYLLSVVVAGGGIGLYLLRLDWPVLAAAVLAVTLVVPEAVSDWTEGSLGVVGGVLVAGVTLLAASLAGYRLRRGATD
jgi:hypothetical protein